MNEPHKPTLLSSVAGLVKWVPKDSLVLTAMAVAIHVLLSPAAAIPVTGSYLLPLEAYGWNFPESLLLFHAQPPVLNIVAFVVHLLTGTTGLSDAAALRLLQCMLTTTAIFSWFAVLRGMGLGLGYRVAFWVLLMAHPMTLFFFDHLNHTTLAPALAGVFALAAWRFFDRPAARTATWFATALALMALTRTVWHLPYVLTVLAFALGYGRRAGVRTGVLVAALGLPLLPVAAWLAKNYLLFGVVGMTSWTGWNLGGEQVRNFLADRKPDWAIVDAYYADRPRLRAWFEKAPATSVMTLLPPDVAPPWSTNGNHFAIPALNQADLDARKQFYREHPRKFIERVAWHLYYFNLRPFENPYGYNTAAGKSSDLMAPTPRNVYLAIHGLVYQGTWLGDMVALRIGKVMLRPSVLPYLLPVIFLVAMAAAVIARNRLAAPQRAVMFLLGVSGLCFLATVILVDGGESSRMRWEVEPMGWVCAMVLIQAISRRAEVRPAGAADGVPNGI